eukprot:COSAG05_NODE_4040_length_1705_cov_2.552927_1_plen_476_part_00
MAVAPTTTRMLFASVQLITFSAAAAVEQQRWSRRGHNDGAAAAATSMEPPQLNHLAIPRQQRFDLRKFGGMSGGTVLNTHAFEAAVSAIKAAGGGELYVPPGVWLTTGFALTSHMSLFLESGATVLGAPPNNSHWRPRNDSCSSYPAVITCRGKPGTRSSGPGGVDERHSGFEPIIGGWNLTDVHITGNNGTLDGQGDLWWAAIRGHGPCAKPHSARWCNLPHGRPHGLLLSRCQRVAVSDITITGSPFWTIRFWASSQIRASNLTITATRTSMNNDGIDVDSSRDAVIEDIYYDGGDDGIALKSGECDAGAEFNTPTANVRIQRVVARTRSSCFVTGSEDQGGVHNVTVRDYTCRDSPGGIILKDTTLPHSAGVKVIGFPKSNFSFSDIKLHNISGYWGGKVDPGQGAAIQGVRGFTLAGVVGDLVPAAGHLQWCSDISISKISLLPGRHGFSCGSNVTSATLDGVALCKPKVG